MMLERGLTVDHTTVYPWVQTYAPELDKRCRAYLKPTNDSWRVELPEPPGVGFGVQAPHSHQSVEADKGTTFQLPTLSPEPSCNAASRPAASSDAAATHQAQPLKTGRWVRCADGFYGHLGAQIRDGRWWVLSAKSLRRDATSRIYATADITPMPIS